MRKKYEWKRTCRKDLTTWYVPDELRKTPKLPILGSFTRSGQIVNQGNLRIASVEAGQCPNCGSSAFTEKKVKIGRINETR